MPRALYLMLCLLLLFACGDGDGPGEDDSTPDPTRDDAPSAAFDLAVEGGVRPGQRLPVKLVGERAGVEVAIFRAADPIEALGRLPGPESSGDGGDFRWDDPRFEEVWRRQATAGHRFVFPRATPGVFVVAARLGERSVARTLVVCDLVTVVKRSSAGTLLYAADAGTGFPAAGVPVLLATESGGKEGGTDGSGVFRSLDPAGGGGVLTAFAGNADHLARPVRMPPVSGSGTDESSPIRTWLATDRPACFPGQTIHFRGILRQREGHRYRVRDTATGIWASDAHGRRIFPVTDLPALVGGEFTGSVPIPRNTPPGTCKLLAGSKLGLVSRDFTVAEPLDPHARVRAAFVPEKPGLGESVSLVIRAEDHYGTPPSGAWVHYRVTGPSVSSPGGREVLARGRRVIEAREVVATAFTPLHGGLYRVEAELRDPGGTLGSGASELEIAESGPVIELEPAKRFCTTGEAVSVRVRVTDAHGGEGPLRGEFRVGDTGVPVELRSGETREFSVSFDAPGRHEVSTTFDVTRAVQTRASCTILAIGRDGEGPPADRLEVVPEKPEYRAGESARMLVLLPADLSGATCLETLEGEWLGSHSVRREDGDFFLREMVIPEALGEACAFEVVAVRDRRVSRARGEFRVRADRRILRVSIEAEPKEPAPGETVRLRVRVVDEDGNPVPATASLSVFDERLNDLARSPAPSIEEFFYGRRSGGVTTASSLSGAAAGAGSGSTDRRGSDPDAEPLCAVPESAGDSVFWEPSLAVGPDGRSLEQTITLPRRAARWRVVARATTPDTRVGTGELMFDAAGAVTVEPHLPALLNEGDIVRVPVSLRGSREHPVSGTLRLAAEGARLMDGEYRQVGLAADNGEAVEVATLVAEDAGDARLATSIGGHSAERRTVVAPAGRLNRFFAAGAVGGDQVIVPFTLPAAKGTGTAKLVVRLHTDPVEDEIQGLRKLTPGSSLGVRVQFAALGAAAGRILPRAAGEPPSGEEERVRATLLLEVESRQLPGGGWGWMDEEAPDPLESIMVLDGLRSLAAGASPVPEPSFDRGLAYLESYLSGGDLTADPVLAACAIRVLASSGSALPAAAAALLDPGRSGQLPPAAVAHLVLALLDADRRKEAAALAAQLDATVHEGGGGAWWGEDGARTFATAPVPTTAAALTAHLALGSKSSLEYAARAGRGLLNLRRGPGWGSGVDTAFACGALLALSAKAPSPGVGQSAVRIRLGNAILGGRRLSAEGNGPRNASVEADPRQLIPGRNRLAIESTGDIEVLWTLEVTWRDADARPPNPELRLGRSIRRRGGAPHREKITARPGDILVVALAVESDRPRRRLVLDCPIPAGTAPLRSPEDGSLAPHLPPGTRMTRDPGRVRLLIPGIPEGATRIEFPLRVVYAGRFHTPPATLRSVDFPSDEGASAEGPMLYAE